MIKIDSVYNRLEFMAKRYFHFLNPKTKKNIYKVASLIKKIEKARIEDQADILMVNFWDYFLRANYQNLKRIIIGRPEILQDVINEISQEFPTLHFWGLQNGSVASTPVGTRVTSIFDYTGLYRSKNVCHTNYAKFKISSCPYCNEGTAKVDIYNKNDVQINHQLDHFFCQARYPYLGLSFFNLVPSCGICNGRKSTTDFNLVSYINPFDKSIDDYFEFYVTNILPDKADDIVIEYNNKIPFPDTALTAFNIINRYNHSTVKKQIFDSYTTLQYHSPKVIENIFDQFGIDMPLENLHTPEIRRQLFQSPELVNDILFQQYGKLKRDIFHYLGLN